MFGTGQKKKLKKANQDYTSTVHIQIKVAITFYTKFEMESEMNLNINKGYKNNKTINKKYLNAWKKEDWISFRRCEYEMCCKDWLLNFRMRALLVSFLTHICGRIGKTE